MLGFLRLESFFEKFQALVVVRESGIFRVLFGLYDVIQSTASEHVNTKQYSTELTLGSRFYLI